MAQLLTRSTGAEELGRLKESAEEAGAIAKELKGNNEDMYLRDKATEENVYKSRLKVLGLDLNAELVIFSACNTSGKGDKAGAGEGFVGLTRSFMYAGTRSILVTHWSVESEAARERETFPVPPLFLGPVCIGGRR